VVKELGEVGEIVGYPGKLNQVFMNIITNAYQAIPDKGEIRIRTFMQGSRVVVTIQDNGLGMSEEVKKHIFEPFYTTKQVGKGTGLGLSISYGIIKDHKGSISVESEPGKGSTFTVVLPLNGKQKRAE
jgi:signal transduction histidine kinase